MHFKSFWADCGALFNAFDWYAYQRAMDVYLALLCFVLVFEIPETLRCKLDPSSYEIFLNSRAKSKDFIFVDDLFIFFVAIENEFRVSQTAFDHFS